MAKAEGAGSRRGVQGEGGLEPAIESSAGRRVAAGGAFEVQADCRRANLSVGPSHLSQTHSACEAPEERNRPLLSFTFLEIQDF